MAGWLTAFTEPGYTMAHQNTELGKRSFAPLITAAILLAAGLLLLFAVKYHTHGLSLSDFTLFYVGNALNFAIVVLIISLMLMLELKNPGFLSSKKLLLFSILVISTLFLVAAVLFPSMDIQLPYYHFLQQPLSRLIQAMLYGVYQLLLLYLLTWLFLSLQGSVQLAKLKAMMYTSVSVLILLFFSYIYTGSDADLQHNYSRENPADIGVVLGAAVWSDNRPSHTLQNRIMKAVQLYQNGTISSIQFTGSNAPGELSEAEVAYNFVKRYNIDLDDVAVEKKTTSTAEQMLFIKRTLMERQGYKKIIVISNRYHLKRIKELSRFFSITIAIEPTEMALSEDDLLYNRLREAVGMLFFWLFALR